MACAFTAAVLLVLLFTALAFGAFYRNAPLTLACGVIVTSSGIFGLVAYRSTKIFLRPFGLLAKELEGVARGDLTIEFPACNNHAEIIANRERYGIKINDKDLYRPAILSEVTIEASREFHSYILAKAMDTPYRTFRINNLHLRRYNLPRGIYRINVPVEKKEIFIKKMKTYDYIDVR